MGIVLRHSLARLLVAGGVLLCSAGLRAQDPARASAWVDSVIAHFANRNDYDVQLAKPALDSALNILRLQGDRCREAQVQSWRGHCFERFGQLDSAVAVVREGMRVFAPPCDSLVLMSLRVNLANALLSLKEVEEVERLCTEALAQWNPAWPFSVARNGLLTDQAIAIAMQGDLLRALEAFREVLRIARMEERTNHEIDALGNIGAVFGMLSDEGRRPAFSDSAAMYIHHVLDLERRAGDRQGMMYQYANLAALAYDRGQHQRALAYLDSAEVLAEELKVLEQRVDIMDKRRSNYEALGNMDSAYHYLFRHVALKDTLLNVEKAKAIAELQEKYESEKKARTIKELEVINLDAELRKAELTRTRNIYLFSGIGILLAAGGLWNRLRYVHRSRDAIQKEKDISESLLHNILPEEVASELREKGYADTREFDQATILFTDFKGFTSISEQLSASELVEELNVCFKAFDGIMEKYRIEKIKTIGDAYMAAGGLPDTRHGSPQEVVQAALEMQAFMRSYRKEREDQGKPAFQMRVGIHTGNVVAGIVGVKKFAYDIWGDTVNTASRMESSGEPDRVNISEVTYLLVKEVPGFSFTARGKVKAKGKGEMEMYFVDQVT